MLFGVLVAEALALYWGITSGSALLGIAVALGGVYFLLAIRWPDLAAMLLFAATPFSLPSPVAGATLAIPTEPMLALALTGLAIRGLVSSSASVPRSSLLAPIAIYLATMLVSCFSSEHMALSLKAWLMLFAYATYGYLAFADRACRRPSRERWTALAAIIGAVWGGYGLMRLAAEGIVAREAYGIGRPFFQEHGTYSAFLSILVPVLLLEALDRRGTPRLGYGAAALLTLAGTVLSFTRAAWLGLVVVIPLLLILWARNRGADRRVASSIAWIGAAAAVVVVTGVGDQLARHGRTVLDFENVSNLERLNRWSAGLEMARAHPWTGVGYDAFGASYRAYREKSIVTDQSLMRMGPHSEPLRALSEAGVLGLMAGAWLVWMIARTGYRVFRRHSDPAVGRLALGITAGLATYFVHGWFNAYPGSEKVGLSVWLGVGALGAMARSVRIGERYPPALVSGRPIP